MHFPMHRHHSPPLIRMKLGGHSHNSARHTAPDVALFFRLATLACRTSVANFCPASRNSKSRAPSSSASGTSTARSTISADRCVDLRPQLFQEGFNTLFPRLAAGAEGSGRTHMT